jgi:hypothetical protein
MRRFALVVASRIQARANASVPAACHLLRPRPKETLAGTSTDPSTGQAQASTSTTLAPQAFCSAALCTALYGRNNLDQRARVWPPPRIGLLPVMLDDQFYHHYQHPSPPSPDPDHCPLLLPAALTSYLTRHYMPALV